ncbi:SurA N-terminal domain-containing protein [Desulfosarcina sp. OttesenSCG-928-A07]|nr:SurA N-terminal domain-containing protein [Desulfosarcina sp. OttesenSCG-928-G17]MDL2329776.1 SurA N-terminal domain-containing protein [Desulfosarcina sp. OttesenSCG-928-A07]
MKKLLFFAFFLIQLPFFAISAAAAADAFATDTADVRTVDRIIAIVNEDIILLSELNARMAPYVERVRQEGLSPVQTSQMLAKLRQDMIDRMVDEKLTDQEVRRQDLSVDDAEIDSTIERIKVSNSFTDEDLRAFLEREQTTMDAYRQKIREQLLRFRLVNYQVKSRIVITDEDIQNYYDRNPDLYGDEMVYHLRNITFPMPTSATPAQRAEVRKQMETIHEKLVSGGDFAALAQTYSKGPGADRGGDIGQFKRSSLSGQIQSALSGLNSGEFTQILDTDRGLQLFYVESVTSGEGRSVEAARQEIQQKLFEERVDAKFVSWLEDLRSRSHIKILN